MRFATIVDDGGATAAVVVDGRRVLPHDRGGPGRRTECRALPRAGRRPRPRPPMGAAAAAAATGRSTTSNWTPSCPDPGAIFTIGLNYGSPDDAPAGPGRPLVYAKLPTSVIGSGAVVSWDRSLTANVDTEVELGVVIGQTAVAVRPENVPAARVFGYTCLDDISSRDPWLDGDQWLLGKSSAGLPGGALGRPRRRGGGAGYEPRLHHQRHADPGRHHRPHAARSPT